MEIFTLGTSAAVPTKERRLSATVIRCKDGSYIILDIGEDFQRAFNEANLRFNKFTLIFISHMHADHVSGLPGFLASLALRGRTEPLVIIGPEGLFAFIFSLIKYLNIVFISETTILEYNYSGIEDLKVKKYYTTGLDEKSKSMKFEQQESQIKDGIVYRSERYTIILREVDHSVKSAGIRIEFPTTPGKFNVEKVKELGIPQGHLYKKIAKGETIQFNGQTIKPLEMGLIDPPKKGPIIAYSGDTRVCESLIALSKEADLLITECTFAMEHQDQAEQNKHMTTGDVIYIAKSASVKNVIATHISNRYDDASLILSELSKELPSVFVANDLDMFRLKDDGLQFQKKIAM
jgi:ribonuclease Z